MHQKCLVNPLFHSKFIAIMSNITVDLLRRKAEHNEGLLADLEELSLHQCEIEEISCINEHCRKLKILYLQNNIIAKIKNLSMLKDLRYLNLALNNVTKIEGLGYVSVALPNPTLHDIFTHPIASHSPLLSNCEFLEKLDLTVNFIDVDALKDSMDHLAGLPRLHELYMMGNPCAEWEHFQTYVAAKLPQLISLDGKEITRTQRIKGVQRLPAMEAKLAALAAEKAASAPAAESAGAVAPDAAGPEGSPWTPAARVELYREMAAEKQEKEARQKEMMPKERDLQQEHDSALAEAKADAAKHCDEESMPKQRNEGKWEFSLEDEDGEGNCCLRVQLPRFMDSSLLDVDLHPAWVTVVIRNKTLRVHWPEPVHADAGAAQRSMTTGELVIKAPKVRQSEALKALALKRKAQESAAAVGAARPEPESTPGLPTTSTVPLGSTGVYSRAAGSAAGGAQAPAAGRQSSKNAGKAGAPKLADLMMLAAEEAHQASGGSDALMTAVKTR